MANTNDQHFKSKVPKIKEDAWLFYVLRMSAYIGHDGMRSLGQERPRDVTNLSATDQAALDATLNANGGDTAATRAWRQARKEQIAEWKDHDAKNWKAMVESCEDNPTAELICLKISQSENRTAALLWDALGKRYNDRDKVTTTHEIGLFNTMTIGEKESRGEWIDRLSKQIISLEGRGRHIDEATRVERLLSGMNTNPIFKAEAATIQLLEDNNWDRVTSLLTSYDKRDQEAKPETANMASSDKKITCHECGERGHKRSDCPNRVKPPRGGKGGKHRGGRGSGGHKPKRGSGGRGNGGKQKNVECNLCGKRGHYASDCNSAKEFRDYLKDKKRKAKKQKDKDYNSDSESSCMIQEAALSLHDMTRGGALDSGCSSHTLDKRAIPRSISINADQRSKIKTARAGETLSTLGRADVGRLKHALVLKPGDLNQNLISIPRLDRSGHITVFGNGEGLVYEGAKITVVGGKLVARAPLDADTNLYQLKDIQKLIEPEPTDHAYLGSAPVKQDIQLWHRRLGHRSKRSIIKYRNEGRIKGISTSVKLTQKDQLICEPCARAKSTRHSFGVKPQQGVRIKKKNISIIKPEQYTSNSKSSTDDDYTSDSEEEGMAQSVAKILSQTKPLSNVIPKISTDCKGPMQVEGTKGQRFYQGFIEADTKFNRAYFSKAKSDAVEHTDHLWNTVLKAEGTTATTYQADGAPELISKDIVKLLAKCETKIMWSPPYTAELNSVIERNHRTIFESGHAMLLESNLPTLFWCEAIAYASIIFNAFPTPTTFGVMSPIEAKYGVVPDVSRFRTFGCICYVHVPKERRARGFIEKAYKAYFLGLDIPQQAYKAWVIDLNEPLTTAHVAFDEVAKVPKQIESAALEFAPESRNVKDFKFLEGFLYRDDEDGLLYVTTRVTVQKGVIVAFRGSYVNNVVSKEESRPIHAADVAKMVINYQISNPPVVIFDKQRTEIRVCDASSNGQSLTNPAHLPAAATEASSQGAPTKGRGRPHAKKVDNSPAATAKGQEEPTDAPVIAAGLEVQSARATRAQARAARTVVQVGDREELTESVNLTYGDMEFTLHMQRLSGCSVEHCLHSSGAADSSEEAHGWDEADLDELHSLVTENRVWTARPLPEGKKAITTKWVRKIKTSGRKKSRLVGRGFNMVQGVDFNETFAPVAKMATFRIFLTIVAFRDLFTISLDVKTAYLNSPIDEDVYLEPPSDLIRLLKKLLKRTQGSAEKERILEQIEAIEQGQKLKLLKAIYGTKQGGRQWWKTIDRYLQSLGFKPNPGDHCFYSFVDGKDYVLILLYVDDVIIGGTSNELKKKYANLIKAQWKISFNGELTEFLNIQISRFHSLRLAHMSQEEYICTFFAQFNFQEDLSVDTPMQENLRLPAEEESDLTDKQRDFVLKFPYQQIIGCILYVNVCTMPMISYAVSALSQFNTAPTFLACKALVRLSKYVYNSRKIGLWLGGGRAIVGYYDADWAGCITTRKSRSGSINFIGNGPVTWYSKMQTGVSQSTLEAEHTASVPAIQNNIWLRNVLKCTDIPNMTYVYATTLYGDNQAAIAISENPMHHQRSKHIHLKYQYVVDQVKKHTVILEYVKSERNCADIFTKPVGKNVFNRHLLMCTGQGEVYPSIKKLRTIESDSLECPRCSCLLPPAKRTKTTQI